LDAAVLKIDITVEAPQALVEWLGNLAAIAVLKVKNKGKVLGCTASFVPQFRQTIQRVGQISRNWRFRRFDLLSGDINSKEDRLCLPMPNEMRVGAMRY